MSGILYVHLLINVINYNYSAGMINIRFFKRPKSVYWYAIIRRQERLCYCVCVCVCVYIYIYIYSSSIGTKAHCVFWPVEQCRSIFSYLPPTLSIFSLPALEDLFYFLFPSFPGSSPSSRPFQYIYIYIYIYIHSHTHTHTHTHTHIYIYRMSQEECAKLRESVP